MFASMWRGSVFFVAALLAAQVGAQYGDTPDETRAIELPTCCHVGGGRWPFTQCVETCDSAVCARGHDVWFTKEECCAPGAAFNSGCVEPLKECYVVDSYHAKTCKKDFEKCSRGIRVWATLEECCAPGGAFRNGCEERRAEPCWVAGNYWPNRKCKRSTDSCDNLGTDAWSSEEDCCTEGNAFKEGCSNLVLETCFRPIKYFPERVCGKTDNTALCNRGWRVYKTQKACCKAAFRRGCTEEDDD